MNPFKSTILPLIVIMSLFAGTATAQDNESITNIDIENDLISDLWISTKIHPSPGHNSNGEKITEYAKPRGTKNQYHQNLQKEIAHVIITLMNKYPDEVMRMIGSHHTITITFTIPENGKPYATRIVDGAQLGIDLNIAQHLLDSNRPWVPAQTADGKTGSQMELTIDLTI